MKKGELAKLYIKSEYGYGAAGSPPKIPGGATLIFEVELLSWKSVKDIMGDGGIIKNTVKEGTGWATPKDEDEAMVYVIAKVVQENGTDSTATAFYSTTTPSDSSDGLSGDDFTVKDGFLCNAIGAAVKTMKKGEVAKLLVKPEYGFGEAGKGAEVPPNATLEVEVTLVNFKKVENVIPDGGVVKKTLTETEEWQRPNAGATVTIAYTARLADGTVFDEYTDSEPLVFVTDDEKAPCEGLEMGVLYMKKGETALLTVQPQYAFGGTGGEGNKGSVPADAVVTYEVTLKDMVKAKETWDMDVDEKIAAAGTAKDKGNIAFKAGKLDRAITFWERAKQAVEFDDAFESEKKRAARALKQSCDLNLAAAFLKVGKPEEAGKAASKVLEADSNNMKALYRRAQAYIATADWVEAEQDIKKGLQLEPANTDFKLLARKLKVAEAAATKKEAKLWAGSFAKMAKEKSKDEDDNVEAKENGSAQEEGEKMAAVEDAAAVEV
jgi:FK506-binding protein 4/5